MRAGKRISHKDLWFAFWMCVCAVCVLITGVDVYFTFCILIFAVYLKVITRIPYTKKINFLHLAFILALFLFSAKMIANNNLSAFYIPVPAVSLLVTVLFNDLQLATYSITSGLRS